MTEQPITPETESEECQDEFANRRDSGRVNPYWLNCDPGYVLDISESGIRLLVRRPPKDCITLPIWTDEIGLHVTAEVVWSRKIGFRQFEVGMRFVDLDDEDRRILREIAIEHDTRAETNGSADQDDEPGTSAPPPAPPESDAQQDPRLAELMARWPRLPEAVRAGIVAMAHAAGEKAA